MRWLEGVRWATGVKEGVSFRFFAGLRKLLAAFTVNKAYPMNRSTIVLGLLIMCGAAYLVSKVFAPAPTVKPVVRVPVVTRAEPAPRVVRERPVPVSTPVAKQVEAKPEIETRFTELREEGRMIRETLMKTEPKANQAYDNVGRNPEYQALVARRRLLEGGWGQAGEAEKLAIVNEVNAIRQQTVGMVLAELARLNSPPTQPAAAPAAANAPAPRGNQTPPPAAPPPIIYM